MFNGAVDSREARPSKASSSHFSGSRRTTEKDLEIARLRDQLKQQEESAKAKEKCQAAYNTQIQAAIQALALQHGQNNIFIRSWQPPGPSSPAAQESGINVPHNSHTPSPELPAQDSNRAPQFVNTLFASGGSAHNSNDPNVM